MSISDELKIWLTGDYTRLSKEDGDKEESDSINNQKALIRNFADTHPEFQLVKHYSDDGYTGVNFNRPGFQEMLEDIQQRKINCIIVKDLSRFGRNYIETGRYLERIFPGLGVRFVAVNDNYDSLHSNTSADQLLLPFKNLINDAYSRDISLKVRSNLEIRRKQGDFVSPSVPYGYRRDASNKYRLVIDENAAEIVRYIFSSKIEGINNQQIAALLNERQVPSPLSYKQLNGLRAKTSFQVHIKPLWYAATISRILEDETYTGTLVQGKTYRPNYKIRKAVKRPREDWYRSENIHEAIISQEDFQLVKSISGTGTRQVTPQETVYPLTGLVYCSCCGQSCSRKAVPGKDKSYSYYGCYYSGHLARCKGYAVNESYLLRTVLSTLRQYMNDLSDVQKLLVSMESQASQDTVSRALEKERYSREAEQQKYKALILSLYEDYRDGILTQEEYLELKEIYSGQVDALAEALKSISMQYDVMIASAKNSQNRIEAFYQYLESPVLTRKIVVSMIKKIYIYPKNKIHILFRFPDEFSALLCFLPKDLSQGLTGREVNS